MVRTFSFCGERTWRNETRPLNRPHPATRAHVQLHLTILTAVPYATTSSIVCATSPESNRIITTASPPMASAFSISRSTACDLAFSNILVYCLISPPSIDLSPAPRFPNIPQLRTVMPKTCSNVDVISYSGIVGVVTTTMRNSSSLLLSIQRFLLQSKRFLSLIIEVCCGNGTEKMSYVRCWLKMLCAGVSHPAPKSQDHPFASLPSAPYSDPLVRPRLIRTMRPFCTSTIRNGTSRSA